MSRCRRHGPEHVCDRCPERYDTDGWGFVHPSLLKGRTPLQTCAGCRRLVTRAEWSLTAWRCTRCAAKPPQRRRAST